MILRELFVYRALIKNLVVTILKLRYRGSVLGVAWSLAHPLLLLAVYTLAFKYIVRIDMDHYPYFLMAGLLPWAFFAGALQYSTGSIIDNGRLIKDMYFPREVLPIAAVLFHFAQLLLALLVFVPAVVLVSGVTRAWSSLPLLPVLLLLHLLFTVGLAFVVSGLNVFFRDVAHLTEVALLVVFWLTPILYPIRMVPPALQPFFKLNPSAAFALAYQDTLFWGRMPEASVLLTIVVWVTVVLLGGHALFRRLSPTFAEEL
jgi:ABC-type polysaccharide/polyol phosphate export permease